MRTSIVFAALLLLSAQPAWAAEAEARGGLLTPSGGLMVWTLVIFVTLLVILTPFAFKPMLAAVEAREQALRDALEQAKKDREESARVLEEHRRQLDGARIEAQKLIADGRAAGEKMRGEILEQARVQQGEVLERAKREIEAEKTKAILALRREAVDLALAGASKVIEKNLDDQANRQLVESFLASLSAAKK